MHFTSRYCVSSLMFWMGLFRSQDYSWKWTKLGLLQRTRHTDNSTRFHLCAKGCVDVNIKIYFLKHVMRSELCSSKPTATCTLFRVLISVLPQKAFSEAF